MASEADIRQPTVLLYVSSFYDRNDPDRAFWGGVIVNAATGTMVSQAAEEVTSLDEVDQDAADFGAICGAVRWAWQEDYSAFVVRSDNARVVELLDSDWPEQPHLRDWWIEAHNALDDVAARLEYSPAQYHTIATQLARQAATIDDSGRDLGDDL
jgi:hypothetical protein